MKCPCCGQAIATPIAHADLTEIGFGVIERSIIRILQGCYPRGMPINDLVRALYPYGSHLADENASVRIAIMRARRKLLPHRWTIPPCPPRHTAVYRLEKLS